MVTDRELLLRFSRKGSGKAFRELVERHIDWVYTVALRQVGGDRGIAEEVCQDVLASMARKSETLAEFSSLEGWLFKATRFTAVDRVRAERRRKNREERAMEQELSLRTGVDTLDWSEAGELLDEAIGVLSEDERDALCLRFFKELRFAEVGQRIGVSEDAARMRVNRGLDKMREYLGRRGVVSTASVLAGVMASHRLVSAPVGLAATIAEVGVGGVSSSIVFLGTGKLMAGICAAAAIAGVGLAIWQASEIGRLEKELTAAERSLGEANSNVESSENEYDAAVTADLPEVREVGVETRVEVEPVVEALDVMSRYQRAVGWDNQGMTDEALEEYIWLYEHGEEEMRPFSGIRNSALLFRLVEIAQTDSQVTAFLERLRDRTELEISNLAGKPYIDTTKVDIGGWSSVNRAFGEVSARLRFSTL